MLLEYNDKNTITLYTHICTYSLVFYNLINTTLRAKHTRVIYILNVYIIYFKPPLPAATPLLFYFVTEQSLNNSTH